MPIILAFRLSTSFVLVCDYSFVAMKSPLPKILIILGPTAVGKSDLAVELALRFNGEVISADSRQVYIGLNIGTGKITTPEMKGVPHHLIDITDPKVRFSVAEYVAQAEVVIQDILKRGKLPIICGGTGFYIQALVDGALFPEVPPNEALREELENLTIQELTKRLKQLDPKRIKTFNVDDSKNPRRLIRAIEIATQLGSAPSLSELSVEQKYNPFFIGLNVDTDIIKEKIHSRLLKRLDAGMVQEVEQLHAHGLTYERMDELGLEYRYVARFLQKQLTLDEMMVRLNMEIWHYAKRQMTWFKRNKRIQWFMTTEYTKIQEVVASFISK